ncbi:MAG: diacylglycerol kinase [bacterium]|nr:diacylglycerol kinase [bacterium]
MLNSSIAATKNLMSALVSFQPTLLAKVLPELLYTRPMQQKITSFSYAIMGLKTAFVTQPNVRTHLIIAIVVSLLGYFLGLSTEELVEIILLVGLVLVAEMINTAIEFVCNAITTEIHPEIKKAKDVAAGSVLVWQL